MVRIWNTAVPVIDLIETETGADAIRELTERLHLAGFDVYEGTLPDGANAFHYEDLENLP